MIPRLPACNWPRVTRRQRPTHRSHSLIRTEARRLSRWDLQAFPAGTSKRQSPRSPADRIERSVLERINQLADELGYVRVDEKWSVADAPPDLRVSDGGAALHAQVPSAHGTRQMPRAFLLLGDRLQTGLFRVSDRFVRAWGSCAGESFLVVATSPVGDDRVARWRADLAARTVTLADASGDRGAAVGGVTWQLTGSAAAWEHVLAGTANLNVALRHRELRYADTGTASGPVTVTRIGMLADLLGITSWRSAEGLAPAHAPSAA